MINFSTLLNCCALSAYSELIRSSATAFSASSLLSLFLLCKRIIEDVSLSRKHGHESREMNSAVCNSFCHLRQFNDGIFRIVIFLLDLVSKCLTLSYNDRFCDRKWKDFGEGRFSVTFLILLHHRRCAFLCHRNISFFRVVYLITFTFTLTNAKIITLIQLC